MNDPSLLAQYGAIGIIAAMALFAVRVLFQRMIAAYDREKERADRLEEELRSMNELIRDRYLASMTRATVTVAEANQAVSSAVQK